MFSLQSLRIFNYRASEDATYILSGLLEIILAIGVWMPGQAQFVGWSSVFILIVFLLANIYAAINHSPFDGNEQGPSYLFISIPFQFFLIAWTLWAMNLTYQRRE